MVYGSGTQLAPLTNHQSLTCVIFIAVRLGSELLQLVTVFTNDSIFLLLTIRWRAISKKIWACCGKMCKSIQSARETKGLLFPLRTCTRAAQCSKISMNCMAQLLLTAFDLIQANFLGFILFLLLDPKVQSEYNTFLKRECRIWKIAMEHCCSWIK